MGSLNCPIGDRIPLFQIENLGCLAGETSTKVLQDLMQSLSTLTPKTWIKNPGGGQERSSLGPCTRQFFPIIRTGYEVSLENSVTTTYTINSINLGEILYRFKVFLQRETRAVPLGNKTLRIMLTLEAIRTQDPGPPKGTANKKEPEAHLCWAGKQCVGHSGPETETRASQTRNRRLGF